MTGAADGRSRGLPSAAPRLSESNLSFLCEARRTGLTKINLFATSHVRDGSAALRTRVRHHIFLSRSHQDSNSKCSIRIHDNPTCDLYEGLLQLVTPHRSSEVWQRQRTTKLKGPALSSTGACPQRPSECENHQTMHHSFRWRA